MYHTQLYSKYTLCDFIQVLNNYVLFSLILTLEDWNFFGQFIRTLLRGRMSTWPPPSTKSKPYHWQ